MVSKSLIKEIILENREHIEKYVVSPVIREIMDLLPSADKAVVIYGVRRSGKTYLLFEIFQNSPDTSLYLDFEDERLSAFKVEDLETTREAFFELNPDLIGSRKVVFLFDEIQRVEGWERFARRMLEKEGIAVYAAGSSTRIHPENIGTSLRGRFRAFQLFPFSFREYLPARGLTGTIDSLLYGRKRTLVKGYFDEYLNWGGFPEVVNAEDVLERKKILKEYLNAMYFRDLVERFAMKNFTLLNALWDMVFSSFSMKFSVKSFENKYRNEFPFSKDSLYDYYHSFIESRLVYEVRKYSGSSYQRRKTPVKIYLCDNGLARRVTSRDWGRLLENLVLISLKRMGVEVFYFEEKRECDFVTVTEDGSKSIFQVVFELNERDREREIAGLLEAGRMIKLKKGSILTLDQEESFEQDGMEIRVLPVWKWILSDRRLKVGVR